MQLQGLDFASGRRCSAACRRLVAASSVSQHRCRPLFALNRRQHAVLSTGSSSSLSADHAPCLVLPISSPAAAAAAGGACVLWTQCGQAKPLVNAEFHLLHAPYILFLIRRLSALKQAQALHELSVSRHCRVSRGRTSQRCSDGFARCDDGVMMENVFEEAQCKQYCKMLRKPSDNAKRETGTSELAGVSYA